MVIIQKNKNEQTIYSFNWNNKKTKIDLKFNIIEIGAFKYFNDKYPTPFAIQIYCAIISLFDMGYGTNTIKKIIEGEMKTAKGYAIERIEGTRH